MAYSIQYKRSVGKDISRLDKREARRVLEKIEKELSADPNKNPSLRGEFEGLRKMRVGDYRVIYAVLERTVLVLRIGHRGEIYR